LTSAAGKKPLITNAAKAMYGISDSLASIDEYSGAIK
jgi:hypothetical protein